MDCSDNGSVSTSPLCSAFGASSAKSDDIDKFYVSYIDVCEDIGVDLADPNDPDKTFPPTTRGIVLGICYYTDEGFNGTWYLREDKIADIFIMLEKAVKGEESSQRFIKSGKLLHVKCLVEHSKYKLGQIIMAANQTEVITAVVAVSDCCLESISPQHIFQSNSL